MIVLQMKAIKSAGCSIFFKDVEENRKYQHRRLRKGFAVSLSPLCICIWDCVRNLGCCVKRNCYCQKVYLQIVVWGRLSWGAQETREPTGDSPSAGQVVQCKGRKVQCSWALWCWGNPSHRDDAQGPWGLYTAMLRGPGDAGNRTPAVHRLHNH